MSRRQPTIQRRVAQLLRTRLLIRQRALRPSHHLRRDCHLSAYDCLELALLLEIEFQLDLSDQEVAAFHTVGDVVRGIARRVGRPGEPRAAAGCRAAPVLYSIPFAKPQQQPVAATPGPRAGYALSSAA